MANLTSYENKRVIITGSNGLVGAHLVQQLLSLNAKVYAFALDVDPESYYAKELNREKFREYFIDINDNTGLQRVLTQIQPHFVFHLAAETQIKTGFLNPFLTFSTNFMGTLNLLEILRNSTSHLSRIVVASTDKAYGEAKVLPYTEETELRAHGPYDTSKASMDLMCQSYAMTFKMPITIIRAGNIYGPGDLNWDRIIPGVTNWLLNNETPVLRGDLSMVRDYIFVKDVVNAYLFAGLEAKEDELQIYNVSSNQPTDLAKMYKTICSLAIGKYVEPILSPSGAPEIFEQRLDSSHIQKKLGWKPEYTFEKALDKTIDWYRRVINGRN